MDFKDYYQHIHSVIQEGPYDDTWDSLCSHPIPKWYQNGKFGIFIHWGVYSVPAFGNEWYPRNMYDRQSPVYKHHVETYGPPEEFGYKEFIPMFKAEKFNAGEWANLIKRSGAKFVTPVGEHHDGFQMYDSNFSQWNAVKMGPGRDILGELKQEIEAAGMTFCTSSHRAEHWWFFNFGREIEGCDVNDEKYGDLYGPAVGPTQDIHDIFDNPPNDAFMQDWLVRTCELVEKYQPKLLYFDWWIEQCAWKPYLKKFAAFYYNLAVKWGCEVAIDAKFDAYAYGSAIKDIERGQLDHIYPELWQNDTSVAKNSWGYTKGNDYKKPFEIVQDLIDIVSKNGALLLNIGPKPDGTIPDEDKAILEAVGDWLSVNGEAIYGTTYWKTFGEGPTYVPEGFFTDTQRTAFTSEDIRFTCKGSVVYAAVMKWPEDGNVKIKSFGRGKEHFNNTIKNISILGCHQLPSYKVKEELLLHADLTAGDMPVVLKITVE